MRIAILDDYQNLALRLADWSALEARGAQIIVFDRHLGEAEAAEALAPFDAVCHLRERMAMPGTLIDQLPRLRCIAITGSEHRTLDLEAARRRRARRSRVQGTEVSSGSCRQHGGDT